MLSDAKRLRPRLINELVYIWSEQRVVVDGLPKPLVIGTDAGIESFKELFALLDGTRNIEDLARELGNIPESEMFEVVDRLKRAGVVENVDRDLPSPIASSVQSPVGFFRRMLAGTGIRDSGAEVLRSLRRLNCVIASCVARPEVRSLQSLLLQSGVGRVDTLFTRNAESLDSLNADAKAFCISLAFGRAEDQQLGRTLHEQLSGTGITWLRCFIDDHENTIEIGPLFSVPDRPCFHCFLSQQEPKDLVANSQDARPNRENRLFVALCAAEIIARCTRTSPLLTAHGAHRFTVPLSSSRQLPAVFDPLCTFCWPRGPISGEASAATGPSMIESLHDRLSMFEKSPQSAPNPSGYNLEVLSRESKRMAHGARISLRTSPMPNDSSASQRLTKEQLAFVLKHSVGIRSNSGEQLRRWAPSAGNLGSAEVFLSVKGISELEDGLYFYDAFHHELTRFESHRARNSKISPLDEYFAASPNGGAFLIFTGSFYRLSRKYGSFAYRLVHLDAGVAMTQAVMIAQSLGLQTIVHQSWDDQKLERACNLLHFEEQVTGLLELSLNQVVDCRQHPKTVRELPAGLMDRELKTDEDLVLRVHGECVASSKGATPDRVLLTSPQAPGWASLKTLLSSRASRRHFAANTVDLSIVLALLGIGLLADQKEWMADPPLSIYFLANNITDFRRGVYLYEGRACDLKFVRELPHQAGLKNLFVQAELCLAAFTIVIGVPLRAYHIQFGCDGYRRSLRRAGALGMRLWFTALEMKLRGGTLSAGIVRGEARRLLLENDGTTPLLLVPLGHSTEGE